MHSLTAVQPLCHSLLTLYGILPVPTTEYLTLYPNDFRGTYWTYKLTLELFWYKQLNNSTPLEIHYIGPHFNIHDPMDTIKVPPKNEFEKLITQFR